MTKSFMKNESLKALRNVLINNMKDEGKLKRKDSKQFTSLLDELLEIVYKELEEGKTFDNIKRTVVDFFIKKKEEVIA